MTTIAILASTENWTDSRTDINANFDAVNTEVEAATANIASLQSEFDTTVVDASTTAKWLSKLSTAPASAVNPIAVSDNDPRVPTQWENDALVGTSGTPSSSNKYVTNDDTSVVNTPNKVVRFDSGWNIPWGSNLIDNSYPAWETIAVWNAVFLEGINSQASSIVLQNVWAIAANTRLDIPWFWSWVSASSISLVLTKSWTPAVNLWVRIEEDNGSWNPNWTLVHANATGSIAAANVPTNLLSSSTLTLGSVFNDFVSTWVGQGYRFLTNGRLRSITVTKDSACTATRAALRSDAWAVVASAYFVGNIATVTYAMASWTYYKIYADKEGLNYTTCQENTGSYPYNTTANINLVSSADWWTSTLFDITVITTEPENETTVTLAGSFTIPAGQKCHTVVFQWTYGSETISTTNFYYVGYNTNNTTTRQWKYWNWSAWVSWSWAEVSETLTTPTSTASITVKAWQQILTKANCFLRKVTKPSNCSWTIAYLQDSGGTTLAQANFIVDVAVFNYYLTNATNYRIVVDNGGSSYSTRYDSQSFPVVRTYINYTWAYYNGALSADGRYNIVSVDISPESSIFSFPFLSTTLLNPRVLSLTNALYAYKTDWLWISQESVSSAQLSTSKFPILAIEWVDSNQTGMTQGTTMYLGNTPWAISSSAGTNPKTIGEAITSAKLQILKKFDNDCITFSRTLNVAGGTVSYTHNLRKVPTKIRITWHSGVTFSTGVYTKWWQRCVWWGKWEWTEATNIIHAVADYSDRYQTGIIQNITATGFDIAWTVVSTPNANVMYFICELE